MRFVLLLLTAVLPLISGCNKDTATPPAAPAQAPQEASQAPPAAKEPPAAEMGRRARAGIDLGEDQKDPATPKKKRVPAAEFIITAPPVKTPAVNAGPRGAAVAGALQWLESQWRPRALGSDDKAYTAMMHEEFKGLRPGKDGTVARDKWLSAREPSIGTPVTWGLEKVTANPNSTGRVTIEMLETEGGPDACRVANRTLTLQPTTPEAVGPWRVTTEERSASTACPSSTIRDVTGAHDALATAWRSRDLIAVRKMVHGGFMLLDGGVESERYNVSALTDGDGRWVLDQLAALTATPGNTRLIGSEAVVDAGGGARFEYRLMGERWRLTTLWRFAAKTP